MRPKILLIADWYLPGYKAGGIITALANLVDSIGDEFDLRVITRDRDLTDTEPYAGVVSGEWRPVGKARVLYTHDLSLAHLRHRVAESQPDIIHFNSFFSPLTAKILVLRKLDLLPPAVFAIAPRGEFSPAALQIKPRKKSLYAAAALRAGLYYGVLWHATSAPESAAIDSFLRTRTRQKPAIGIAPDLLNRNWSAPDLNAKRPPKSSPVKFLFLSRISRIKNLLFVLDALAALSAPAELHIYGPIDDSAYWAECQRKIEALPQNIRTSYHGAVPHEQVPATFRAHDFCLLPTEGENFGYVVLESLAAGCPVVVSDRTPWRDLREKGVGWAISLEDPASWRATLTDCAEMDAATNATMSLRARGYVRGWLEENDPRLATVDMFHSLVEKRALSQPPATSEATVATARGAAQTKSI